MAKKSFDSINTERAGATDTGKVYQQIETGTTKKGQQGAASPEEAAERRSNLKTQGRKGVKAIRINMAFTPENHEFIKIMASLTGQSMTEMCNYMLDKYREDHGELFDQAKAIKEQL